MLLLVKHQKQALLLSHLDKQNGNLTWLDGTMALDTWLEYFDNVFLEGEPDGDGDCLAFQVDLWAGRGAQPRCVSPLGPRQSLTPLLTSPCLLHRRASTRASSRANGST